MRGWAMLLVAAMPLGLVNCGGDEGSGSTSGPTAVLQVNCPGAGPGTAPFAGTDIQSTGSGTGTGNGTGTGRTGRSGKQELAQQRRLKGVPTRQQGDNSVGDTKIDVDVDCGGNPATDTTTTTTTTTNPPALALTATER